MARFLIIFVRRHVNSSMVIAKYLNLYFIKDKISKLTFPFLYIIAKYLIVITSEEHLIIVIMDNCEKRTCSITYVKGNRSKVLLIQAKYLIIL